MSSKSSIPSAAVHLEVELKANKHVALAFFRGNWCPFCAGWTQTLDKDFVPGFVKIGGKVIAFTAQDDELAQKAQKDWKLSFDVFSDPENELAKRFRVAISDKEGYPNGMAQPALIILTKGGEKELFNWRIQPSVMNLGGAKDRPHPKDVLDLVKARLSGQDEAKFTEIRAFDSAYLKENYGELYAGVEQYVSSVGGEVKKVFEADVAKGGSKIKIDSAS
mmetsp:Transcript_44866/g.72059  ORF Transcript_44866/g.72059 Transcript_44866/m.72059 type:complete len:220 (-) Transcript_44866:189-848(-)|eukprot:jgi/Bigna1/86096/estExt_fgenesh1_pg.C_80072